MTSGNFSTAAIDSPLTATGILPPITGESYTGSLPSLSLMDSKSTDYSMNSAGVPFSISDSQLATAYSEPASMLAAGQQQKDPHSESAHLTQLLSMPLFLERMSQVLHCHRKRKSTLEMVSLQVV